MSIGSDWIGFYANCQFFPLMNTDRSAIILVHIPYPQSFCGGGTLHIRVTSSIPKFSFKLYFGLLNLNNYFITVAKLRFFWLEFMYLTYC